MDKNENIKDIKANNQIISSTLEKSSLIIKLVYEIKKKKYIKLFDYYFFKRNKRKIKIIIHNNLCNLEKNYKKISNDNMKILKIKLIILNTHEINFNRMFYGCCSLNSLSIKSKFESKIKNKLIKEQKENKFYS